MTHEWCPSRPSPFSGCQQGCHPPLTLSYFCPRSQAWFTHPGLRLRVCKPHCLSAAQITLTPPHTTNTSVVICIVTLVNKSANQPTNQSIDWSINKSINQWINQSFKQSINQSISQSINPSSFLMVPGWRSVDYAPCILHQTSRFWYSDCSMIHASGIVCLDSSSLKSAIWFVIRGSRLMGQDPDIMVVVMAHASATLAHGPRLMNHGWRSMMHDSWIMDDDPWCMTHESWMMIHAAWLMNHGSWSMMHDSWIMDDDPWIMTHASWVKWNWK